MAGLVEDEDKPDKLMHASQGRSPVDTKGTTCMQGTDLAEASQNDKAISGAVQLKMFQNSMSSRRKMAYNFKLETTCCATR